jgi:hypothetical protein
MDTPIGSNQHDVWSSFTEASLSQRSETQLATSQEWAVLWPFDHPDARGHHYLPSHNYNQHRPQMNHPLGRIRYIHPQSQTIDDHSLEGNIHVDNEQPYRIERNDHKVCSKSTQDSQAAALSPDPFLPGDSPGADADLNTIGSRSQPYRKTTRVWCGMHAQQAQQATLESTVQERPTRQSEMKFQAQKSQYCQFADAVPSQSQGEGLFAQQRCFGTQNDSSRITDSQVEECISRLLSHTWQDSSTSGDFARNIDKHLPIAGPHGGEEETDEDEHFLNSIEGAQLSSKERRQLRNKVSARAFRSKRKSKTNFAKFWHRTTNTNEI